MGQFPSHIAANTSDVVLLCFLFGLCVVFVVVVVVVVVCVCV